VKKASVRSEEKKKNISGKGIKTQKLFTAQNQNTWHFS